MNIKTKVNSFSFLAIKKQIPNCLSILRMLLSLPICLLLLNENFAWSLGLFLVATISDSLDGYIAKKTDSTSQFGSVVDPIADKVLLVSIFATLTYLGQIPVWLCTLVVVRDLAIVAAVTGYFLVSKDNQVIPSLISKINTFLQFILILYLLLMSYFQWQNFIEWVLIALVTTSTIISGVDYAYRWIRKAYTNLKGTGI